MTSIDKPKRGNKAGTRIEKDSLGEREVPADALFGIQTLRALENFRAGGMTHPESLLRAYIMTKEAAAPAHEALVSGKSIRAIATENGILSEAEFEKIANPLKSSAPEKSAERRPKRRTGR